MQCRKKYSAIGCSAFFLAAILLHTTNASPYNNYNNKYKNFNNGQVQANANNINQLRPGVYRMVIEPPEMLRNSLTAYANLDRVRWYVTYTTILGGRPGTLLHRYVFDSLEPIGSQFPIPLITSMIADLYGEKGTVTYTNINGRLRIIFEYGSQLTQIYPRYH